VNATGVVKLPIADGGVKDFLIQFLDLFDSPFERRIHRSHGESRTGIIIIFKFMYLRGETNTHVVLPSHAQGTCGSRYRVAAQIKRNYRQSL
jgi:hypothetical protein